MFDFVGGLRDMVCVWEMVVISSCRGDQVLIK